MGDDQGGAVSVEPSNSWGRIDEQGTVYVTTRAGERAVGQWPGGDPDEAIALYTRRFEGLRVEVDLLDARIKAGTLGPDEAAKAVSTLRQSVADAHAVGDLDALADRLDALEPEIASAREARKVARVQKTAEAQVAKSAIADEAEGVAAGDDWRAGADRLRELLEQWKSLPRLDKRLDDEIWHRFSSARTSYTRRRKAHFSEQSDRREQARVVKESLVKEAEALSTSTEWGPTAGAYRDLMQRWKAAGPAPRGVDARLWKRFRAAQDVFFSARDDSNAQLDLEYEANAEVKATILADAEALLPVQDVEATRTAWMRIAERWDAAGKVPRASMKEYEARIRTVEEAIEAAGQQRWDNTNPEARARADETITKLEKSLAALQVQLDKAEGAGNEKAARDARESIEARESWLEQARRALSDFS